ncbi:MAG: hypothetical protein WKF77_14605 [Planctomycetaceae bacterium]
MAFRRTYTPEAHALEDIRLIFEKFTEFGSLSGVMRYLNLQDLKIDVRSSRSEHASACSGVSSLAREVAIRGHGDSQY